ncbi:D-alanyl-D-alanine carboxypeptidase family protein [Aurantimonas sp. Leaf443]|uniref:D-alanyl-D-alanine carboxypeptidase family protein n=1 Tax=Aurantimonas sp. Leaf443 TaxID=1736378 RepID=UPI0006FC7FB1|nr:D-alanyl-D-alanine carboxypeptidase family protein [Aurantimonas sp. Leaf443]KQT82463.1 penicillin-binding protein [Aurantimonas sp. Leaf443]
MQAARFLAPFRRSAPVAALVRPVFGLALACLVLVGMARPASAAFETTAPVAVLLDHATGTVLYEKDADRRIAPASMVKLMTVAVIFDELRKGTVTRETVYTVSEDAWRTGGAASGGSTMFLPLNSSVSLGDLVKGIVIQSGNDATIVAAEGIAGSIPAFAQKMNALGASIGLTGSQFANPHGLPDPQQWVTVRDLVRLARYLIDTYPEEYHLFSEESFTFNKITQRSRNPLLRLGADGLKTGHTSEAGYGLVASTQRDGRRIVFAMSGMRSVDERAREAKRLMDYGLQSFEEVVLLKAGETAGTADVRAGVEPKVALVSAGDIKMLVPAGEASGLTRTVVDNGPVEAPVARGTRLGWVRIMRGQETVRQDPLFAGSDVERAGFFRRIADTIAGHVTWKSATAAP